MEMNHNWLKDPEVFQVNRLTATSLHHYYATKDELFEKNSSFVHNLNGLWKFHYANALNEVIPDFFKEDYDCSTWKDILVPGHIQMQGYGTPMYVNIAYPWSGTEEIQPGEIPNNNPVGSYVTYFDASILKENTDTRIVFHGAESALALWVNGNFVGYSEDSFTPSIFDISQFIKEGRNKIAVNVYRFSSGSWLEDQDFWRFSGIFRDVELLSIPHVHVNNLKVTTSFENFEKPVIHVTTDVLTKGDSYSIHYVLSDPKGNIVEEKTTKDTMFSMEVENPFYWSSEKPYLYHLELEVADEKGIVEILSQKVGIREFKLKDGIMYLNKKRIIFHGVDRHEFCCESGRVVSYETTKQDILNMKANNINAIRTSHYPNQQFLYDLCDEYGIYVIDETNMETHGTWAEGFDAKHIVPDDKPEWLENVKDRARSMYERDKNHASILIWSCGNESFGGKDIYEMSEFFRKTDPTRLVHYEGIANDNRYPDTSDMYSRMYTPAKDIETFLQEHTDKPFILCEYAHAMGNSNGALFKYTDLEKKYDHYQGGFIWDYIDQAILKDGKLHYGGDFRERPSDYDFCGNGIMFADRSPTPKLQEVKYCYQQVDMKINEETIVFKNNYLFTNLNEFEIRIQSQKNGKTVDEQKCTIDCEPGKEVSVKNPFESKTEGLSSILVTIQKDGHEVAHEQFVYPHVYKEEHVNRAITVTEDLFNIGVHSEGFHVIFHKAKGLVSYKVRGKEFIRVPVKPNFYRAATNNDVENQYGYRYGEWLTASLYARCKYCSYEKVDQHFVIHYEYELPNISIPVKMDYEVYGNGEIVVDMSLEGTDGHIEMPEFGFLLQTYPELTTVHYFGLGPDENYIDRKKGAILGNYTYQVKENVTPYLYPQECGNRCDVYSTTIKEKYHALSIQGDGYECSVLPYTPYEIENAKHHYELPEIYQTVISVNEKQMGIAGDNTWGARTHDEFLLSKDKHHLRVSILGK